MTDALDVLSPDVKELTVDGETIPITKLSMRQWLGLGRWAAEAAAHMAEAIPEDTFRRMAANETSNLEDMLAMIEALDEDHLARLLAILTGKTPEWVTEHFDMDWVLDYLIALNEVQPLAGILGKVMKLRASLKNGPEIPAT